MSAKTREVAESAFEKYQRREAEIAGALRQEQARHDAAIKNMHRLRSLRLQQEANAAAERQDTSVQDPSDQIAQITADQVAASQVTPDGVTEYEEVRGRQVGGLFHFVSRRFVSA
jgi:hypothetical protein